MDRLSPPATGAAGRCAGRDGSGPAAACEEVTAACPRGDEATRGCERALPRTRRSAAAHDRAPPTPGAGAGRGDTGPRGCGRNRAHSTKRPMHVRRAERPAIAVRTARPPRGIGAGHERGAPSRGAAARQGRPRGAGASHGRPRQGRPRRPRRQEGPPRSGRAEKRIEPPPSPARARSIARGAVSRRCGTSSCRRPGRCPGRRACRSSS